MELVKFPLQDFSKALFSGYKESMRSCFALSELALWRGAFWGEQTVCSTPLSHCSHWEMQLMTRYHVWSQPGWCFPARTEPLDPFIWYLWWDQVKGFAQSHLYLGGTSHKVQVSLPEIPSSAFQGTSPEECTFLWVTGTFGWPPSW